MTRAELHEASELLTDAADEAADSDVSERLRGLAEKLGSLADSDHGPDHGTLARIQTSLDEIQVDVSDDVAATIEEALDELRDYRETLEGV